MALLWPAAPMQPASGITFVLVSGTRKSGRTLIMKKLWIVLLVILGIASAPRGLQAESTNIYMLSADFDGNARFQVAGLGFVSSLSAPVSASSDVVLYTGATSHANRTSAPFRVTHAGAVAMSSATITGGSVAIGNATIDAANGVTIAPDTSSGSWFFSALNAYRFTAATGSLGTSGRDHSTAGRHLVSQSEWTGAGDRGTQVMLRARHQPSSGGSGFSVGTISVAASGSTSSVNVASDSIVLDPGLHVVVNGGLAVSKYLRLAEMTAPGAPETNALYLFARVNASGKTEICVRFATGAIQVLATEP
jgi:hypothetical protein